MMSERIAPSGTLLALWKSRDLVFSKATQRRLVIVVIGTIVISVLELLATLMVPAMVATLAGGTPPAHLGRLAEALDAPSRADFLVRVTTIIIGIFVLKDLITTAFRWWMLGFIEQSQADAATHLLETYLDRTDTEARRGSTPEMLRLFTGSVTAVYNGVIVNISGMFTEVLTLIMMCLALQATLPGAALPVVAVCGIVIAVSFLAVSHVALRAGRADHEATLDTYRVMQRGLGGFKELRLRGTSSLVVSAYRREARRAGRARRMVIFLNEAPRHILEVIILMTIGAVIVANAHAPDQTIAALGTLVVISFRAMPAVTRLVGGFSNMRASLPAVGEILRLLNRTAGPTHPGISAAPTSDHDPGVLTLRHEMTLEVDSFCYSEERTPALRDLHGVIPQGTRLAIAGPSGAGKSTLMDLLSGLFTRYEGRILIDGVNLRGREVQWRRSVGVVPQDPYITEASLRDNIVFDMNTAADEHRLAEAVRLASLQDVVDNFPDGLDTIIGEGGHDISGGQRQRIAIARALYRGATFLILDEATSALDDDNEHAVLQAILGLPPEVTVVCVAHRMSTILSMDKLAFMDSGAVTAYGTPAEVLAHEQAFRRWVSRSSGLINDLDTLPDPI